MSAATQGKHRRADTAVVLDFILQAANVISRDLQILRTQSYGVTAVVDDKGVESSIGTAHTDQQHRGIEKSRLCPCQILPLVATDAVLDDRPIVPQSGCLRGGNFE